MLEPFARLYKLNKCRVSETEREREGEIKVFASRYDCPPINDTKHFPKIAFKLLATWNK